MSQNAIWIDIYFNESESGKIKFPAILKPQKLLEAESSVFATNLLLIGTFQRIQRQDYG